MSAPLVSKQGQTIPELEMKISNFLLRNIVIYGPSNTGKTVCAKDIMHTLKQEVDQVLVIAPTNTQNDSYTGLVPDQFIHTDIYLPPPVAITKKNSKDKEEGACRFMSLIIERQKALVSEYRRSNNISILKRIYKHVHGDPIGEELAKVNSKRSAMHANLEKQVPPSKIQSMSKSIDEQCDKIYLELYKKAIRANMRHLIGQSHISKEDKQTINFIDVNPHLLLILDDCAATMKFLFKSDVFSEIFYQGRHNYITLILICQDDVDLPTSLRKNAYISIFTSSVIANTYFTRMNDKTTSKTAIDAIDTIFRASGDDKYRRMAYIREPSPGCSQFSFKTFPVRDSFRFGSDALYELCDKVKDDGSQIQSGNRFSQVFERFSK
jgi:hypothetical protein